MALKLKVLLSEFYFAIAAPDGTESEAVEYGGFAIVTDRLGVTYGATVEGEDEKPNTYRMAQVEHVIEGDYEFTDQNGDPLPPPEGVEIGVDDEETLEEDEADGSDIIGGDGVDDSDDAALDDDSDEGDDDEDDAA